MNGGRDRFFNEGKRPLNICSYIIYRERTKLFALKIQFCYRIAFNRVSLYTVKHIMCCDIHLNNNLRSLLCHEQFVDSVLSFHWKVSWDCVHFHRNTIMTTSKATKQNLWRQILKVLLFLMSEFSVYSLKQMNWCAIHYFTIFAQFYTILLYTNVFKLLKLKTCFHHHSLKL